MSLDVSICIPCCKNRAYLQAYLGSLFEKKHNVSFEVIVVNDCSADGTEEMLHSMFPLRVTYIENPQKTGIGRCRNIAMHKAQGRYIIQSDADIEIIADFTLDRIVDFLDSNEAVGICGPRILYPDGTLQHTCRRYTTVLPLLFRRTFLGNLFPNARVLRDYLMSDWAHNEVRDVEYLAAFYVIRRKVFEQIGPMKNYKHGPEDQEYCFRAKRHGWRVVYLPGVEVVHHYQRVSAKKLNMALLQFYEMLDFWISLYPYKTVKYFKRQILREMCL